MTAAGVVFGGVRRRCHVAVVFVFCVVGTVVHAAAFSSVV
jgi:hypothetical protein